MPALKDKFQSALVRRRLAKILSLQNFEHAARKKLPHPIYQYIAGAAEDNVSFADNRSSFNDYWLIPRALVNISRRSTEQDIFGSRYQLPVGIAPMGISALSAYRGDIVMASAAADMGIPFIMSGSSLIPMEELRNFNPDTWFQAYLPGTEQEVTDLIERIRVAGFKTLVITVDTPIAANRENNVRAGFSTPLKPSMRLAMEGLLHPSWLFGTFLKTMARHGMPHFENNYATRGSPILSRHVERDFADRGNIEWRHLEMIRQQWNGNLVLKGILNATDAKHAVDVGVDGVIVSNHGGRQLDGAIPPLKVLPEIVEACPELPVMLDSGVRRGTDVIKALALGASFVFVGRPFGFAAAVAGQPGTRHAIELLKQEVSRDMALLGVCSVDAVTRDLIRRKET